MLKLRAYCDSQASGPCSLVAPKLSCLVLGLFLASAGLVCVHVRHAVHAREIWLQPTTCVPAQSWNANASVKGCPRPLNNAEPLTTKLPPFCLPGHWQCCGVDDSRFSEFCGSSRRVYVGWTCASCACCCK